MLLQNTPAMKRLRGDKGFTLVELLVVIVIIGILVAIAVPIFLNQRESAQKRAVESDVRNAVPVMEMMYSEDGKYDSALNGTALTQDDPQGFAVSKGVTLKITATDQAYEITGTHSAIDAGGVHYDSKVGQIEWDDAVGGATP